MNSLSFSPWNEWILATASADSTVNLFDMRRLSTALHTFSCHACESLSLSLSYVVACSYLFLLCRDAVLQVEWSPKHETVLASSAVDRRLMVWDLSRFVPFSAVCF